jgi:beta-ureidopropionase
LAESADGETYERLKHAAKAFNMVIVASILEKSDSKTFNTCIVISNHGGLLGTYRKQHIPPIEAPYLAPAPFENPIFDTDFGKIGILICYERHFPLKWLMLALSGAEIILNPSSEDRGGLSERMWLVEGMCAAVANGVFTASINRTGVERVGSKTVEYFGTSYVASPEGNFDGLDGEQGLLIAEIDLNAVKRAKGQISFHKIQNYQYYAKELGNLLKQCDSTCSAIL